MGSSPKQSRLNEQKNEIRETYRSMKKRNAELQEIIDVLGRENAQYKKLYNKHKQRITTLANYLEQSTKIFAELLDNNNSALQITRLPVTHSPIPRTRLPYQDDESPKPGPSGNDAKTAGSANARNEETSPQRKLQMEHRHDVQSSIKVNSLVFSKSPNADPSTNQVRHVTRRKIHIDRLDLQKLKELSGLQDEDDAKNSVTEASTEEGCLSTILEENSSNLKEVSVKITRLPEDMVYQHLRKQKISQRSNSSFHVADSFTNDSPVHSSTPNKLEVMSQLGLRPTVNLSPLYQRGADSANFVTTRKKSSSSTSDITGSLRTRISVKKECCRCSTDTLSPKQEQLSAEFNETSNSRTSALKGGNKRRKTLTEVTPQSTRPVRTARPKDLKEASLLKKLRRT